MITAYEQTFDPENSETTDGVTDAVQMRRQAYYLAVVSFICNMVRTVLCFIYYVVQTLLLYTNFVLLFCYLVCVLLIKS